MLVAVVQHTFTRSEVTLLLSFCTFLAVSSLCVLSVWPALFWLWCRLFLGFESTFLFSVWFVREFSVADGHRNRQRGHEGVEWSGSLVSPSLSSVSLSVSSGCRVGVE